MKSNEKGIYEKWYEEIKENRKTYLHVELNSKSDIFDVQNFFLVCQRIRHEFGNRKKLNLDITCRKEDEYRVKHLLYLAIHYSNVGQIRVNGKRYKGTKEVNFYRILPLVLINWDMCEFLGMKVLEVLKVFDTKQFVSSALYDKMSRNTGHPDTRQLLIRICIYNLIGDINAKNFSECRREYFCSKKFNDKIIDVPILAMLIFSVSIRAKNMDSISKKREEELKKREIKKVVITKKMAKEIFPSEEEIDSELFNAWDISDGIFQLLENIVFHATSNNNINYEERAKCLLEKGGIPDGEGVLCLRLHDNDVMGDDTEFNGKSELFGRFPQYFRGYNNIYVDGETEEITLLSETVSSLSKELSKGHYVNNQVIKAYDKERCKIEGRRHLRKKAKYFLEIQVSDFSGKFMCDVFCDNLIKRDDPSKNYFYDMKVRTFFDPTSKESNIWKRYYRGDNGIQHYGLQIFLSTIMNNEGGFDVKSLSEDTRKYDYYSNTGANDTFTNMLPGTKYSILLPMKSSIHSNEYLNTFMNTDINYTFQRLEEFEESEYNQGVIDKFYKKLHEITQGKPDKVSSAKLLRSILSEIRFSSRILLFDCRNINNNIEFELFCKALILFIAGENCDANMNIAITYCDVSHFVSFIRFISIYYDKNGNCDWMASKQIYLCGKASVEEFLVSGRNIQEMVGRVEKLAFTRELNPRSNRLLTKMLERRIIGMTKSATKQDDSFVYTPFDLLIKNSKQQTVFEQNVLSVLERNIQKIESGCKIYPTHMRLGSKLHIHSFYEAELLFYNNYYVNRFAYLLIDKLMDLKPNFKYPIWFIGYETYSEMLICRLKQYISDLYSVDTFYSIYETARGSSSNQEENFCYCDDKLIKKMINKKAQIFLVVPVNTTLTTFSKLELALEKRIEGAINGNFTKKDFIRGYFGIIQIRDGKECGEKGLTSTEEIYWDEINVCERWIKSKKLFEVSDTKVYYLICIKTIWEEPVKCEKCYPDDCIFEAPLIETDRTSVVPTQLIGLTEYAENDQSTNSALYKSYGEIKTLVNHFYYDHIERGSNHFHLYVRTANYFRDYAEDIKRWMRDVVSPEIHKKKRNGCLSFDVLVNPLHFSNAAFVEAVNEEIFNGASYTLRIDVGKEFRDNVETKFSDLKLLYSKLQSMNIQAEINFYFIDDCINLGASISRTRHLISSLFSLDLLKGESSVKIDVFKGVIVLINRLSYASIQNYVDDVSNYFYYLDLRISSMRTHEDACYLCKEVSNARKLRKISVTNKMVNLCEDKISDYSKKSLNEAKRHKKELDIKDKKYYERYYRRIYCTHTLNLSMTNLERGINDSLEVLRLIVKLISEKKNNKESMEYMMSYLYIYAHPFVSYRKSCREGVFALVIVLLEYLIMPNTTKASLIKRARNGKDKKNNMYIKNVIEEATPLFDQIDMVRDEKEKIYDLFKLLLHLSAELKANHITRKDRIIDILAFNRRNAKSEEEENSFYFFYLALVKRILSLNLDESKSTHFECMLNEYGEDMVKKCEEKELDRNQVINFLQMLYVENTSTIYGALQSLKNGDSFRDITLDKYFYDNFKRILKINKIQNQVSFSGQLLELYNLLTRDMESEPNSKINGITFYERFSEKACRMLDAKQVRFALKTEERILTIDKDNKVVYEDVNHYKVFASSNSEIESVDDIIKQVENRNFLLDTFLVLGDTVIVQYPVPLGYTGDENKQTVLVFIVINFENKSLKEKLQRFRFLLLFRESISERLMEDFDNNIIQKWLEESNIMTQLRKARSGFHTDDENLFDYSKIWTLSNAFVFGDKSKIINYQENCEGKQEGCILGLMMNIRIGRSNILLLSRGEFMTASIKKNISFVLLKEDINVFKKIYFYDKLDICDKNGKSIENGEIFSEETYGRGLAKGKKGYYSFRDYLLYFIFELLHSAYVNGRENDDKKVQIKVYDEEEYLFFENEITEDFDFENVKKGLRREEAGISLATICEFFIRTYDNRFVHLQVNNNCFVIGIPIFEIS